MASQKASVLLTGKAFTKQEKWNISCHIFALVFWSFGREAYDGSVAALATNRYDYEASQAGVAPKTFQRIGVIGTLAQIAFIIGANLVGPLLRQWRLKRLILTSTFVVMICSTLLLIIDASTGGHIKPKNWHQDHGVDDFSYFGHYNTDIIIPISFVKGLAVGVAVISLKVLPQQIVGTNVQKLSKMVALSHIFHRVSSAAGAFVTALVLIPHFGTNYSFMIAPICFFLAIGAWACMSCHPIQSDTTPEGENNKRAGLKAKLKCFILFPKSFFSGAKTIFSARKFLWLLPVSCPHTYGHLFLETSIATAIAKRYFGVVEWEQIIIGGSNFGELFGALGVLLFAKTIRTPIPWLRLDALMSLTMWFLPFWHPRREDMRYAWVGAGGLIPISLGWAAAEVSLLVYMQANMGSKDDEQPDEFSELGAALGFCTCSLHTTYC